MAEDWDAARLDHRNRQAAAIAAGALSLLAEHGGPGLTMAAIAEQAEISRQTLYRYYPDVDAVLVGVAELVTAHDAAFAQLVGEQPDPLAQLELIADTLADDGHTDMDSTTLIAALPPAGRDILADHQDRACILLADVLQRGMDQGVFGPNLEPRTDAPLILGLLAAAKPDAPRRPMALLHRLIETKPEENTR